MQWMRQHWHLIISQSPQILLQVTLGIKVTTTMMREAIASFSVYLWTRAADQMLRQRSDIRGWPGAQPGSSGFYTQPCGMLMRLCHDRLRPAAGMELPLGRATVLWGSQMTLHWLSFVVRGFLLAHIHGAFSQGAWAGC